MTADSDGFLGRWARRKALARSGAERPAEPVRAEAPAEPVVLVTPVPPVAVPSASVSAAVVPSGSFYEVATEPAEPARAAPTLADAQQLTPASDFRPFVARAVAPEVRNAAFKQLFADPHFNVMDGLDIYIDDYSRPDPLPLAVARELLAAQFPSTRVGNTPRAATMLASETQAAAAAQTNAADTAPDASAALPRSDAAQNGADSTQGAEPPSTDGSQRDQLSLDPHK